MRPRIHWHDRLAQGLLLVCCVLLALFLLAPMAAILVKSVQDKSGAFVGLLQFRDYFATPALQSSIWNTFWVAIVVTGITIPLAFAYAYALTRSCMRGKILFRVIALTPILAPSLMSAISFIQWFGNQGAMKWLLGGATVYGPLGIILSAIYATFPRIWGISVMTDQMIAGLTMKIVGGAILWTVITVVFFRWARRDQTEGWDALQWRDVDAEIRAEMGR